VRAVAEQPLATDRLIDRLQTIRGALLDALGESGGR
jgi:hypothetical protein